VDVADIEMDPDDFCLHKQLADWDDSCCSSALASGSF